MLPEAVSKWAEEDNWMGGDVVIIVPDTAEVTINVNYYC